MSEHYILEGKTPKAVDLLTWARWLDTATGERTVGKTDIAPDIRVSTVFLGLDHNFGRGEPVLFETMVFGGKFDMEQERYSTWDEAEAGHAAMVARVKASS